MNPLFKFELPEASQALPKATVKIIKNRIKYINEGVSKVEKASGLSYPPYYVEPALLVSSSSTEIGQLGVLYARICIEDGIGGVQIWVQLSAPLVAYGLRSTINAVLAHEFMHYVELVRKFASLDIISDEVSSTLHQALYSDYEKLFEPKWLFKDKSLIKNINTKFSDGLVDEQLNRKTVKNWVEKNLPTINIPPDANVVRIPVMSIMRTNFDPLLKNRIEEIKRISK
ncbi:MAG TPA: hypothetical protein VIH27_07465 [Nitrososphaerales archaeon]